MKQQFVTLSCCCGLLLLLVLIFLQLTKPPTPRLIACDVGQGDAFLAQFGTFTVLIDSGPNQAVTDCLAKKLAFGQKKIPIAILSHWDADHVGGFSDITSSYTVDTVFANPKTKETKVAEAAWSAASRSSVFHPVPGDEIIFPGGRIRFLWSAEALKGGFSSKNEGDAENSGSVGLIGLFPGFGFLSLGDLECRGELAVSSLPLLNSVPILKVSHHGSKFSSCPDFLAQIHPEVAIVSAGKDNKYGHPDREVLQNLAYFGLGILRTDELGSLEMQSAHNGWLVQTERTLSDWHPCNMFGFISPRVFFGNCRVTVYFPQVKNSQEKMLQVYLSSK